MPPEIVYPVGGFIAIILSIGLVLVGTNAAKVFLNRRFGSPALRPGMDEDRLTRIEQAVDSIAVEVERISEAQRFTTKLLAGRDAAVQVQDANRLEGK